MIGRRAVGSENQFALLDPSGEVNRPGSGRPVTASTYWGGGEPASPHSSDVSPSMGHTLGLHSRSSSIVRSSVVNSAANPDGSAK